MSSRSRRPVSAGTEPRRRSPDGRLRRFLRAGLTTGRLPAFLLSVGLLVLVIGCLTSRDFVVRSVVVRGNDVAFADSIVSASQALGQPIFRLDSDVVASRVAAHPAVESVSVSAQFPDTVVVRVHERTPVLVWQAGDRAVLVDRFGWVVAEGGADKLPRVLQQDGELARPGQRLAPQLVQAALYVQDRLGSRLQALSYDRTGLTAQLGSSRTVVLGDPEQMPLKLSVLDGALKLPTAWTRLDVREPDRPYYQ